MAIDAASSTLPGVTITNNSGSQCKFTVIKYLIPPGVVPIDPEEMPVLWDITSDGNSLNVTIVFSYTDAELANGNNVTEANLKTFRHPSGETWTNMGGTVDTGVNTVTLTNVTSLSHWTLGDPTNPTALNTSTISEQSRFQMVGWPNPSCRRPGCA